ncbi:MAG: hypothetical protein Q4E65_08105 [Clostridia bacterium]|nr:hypothetical protein [Clostridia bacterium]
MTNEEKILDILALMQSEMQGMETRLENKMTEEIHDAEARISMKIENEVSRKIEALFDGYKLTHEKQWELERRMNDLERQFEEFKSLVQAG